MIDPLASADYKGPGQFVATESIGFDPAPREVLKRQFAECSTTMQNGTCPGHHGAVAIRTANTHANGCGVAVEASHTMDGANGQAVATPICFQQNQRCEVRDLGGAAGALQSEAGMKQQNYVAIGIDPYNSASTGEVSKTLNSAAATDKDHIGAVALAVPVALRGRPWDGDCNPTLTQSNNSGGIGASNQELFAQNCNGLVIDEAK